MDVLQLRLSHNKPRSQVHQRKAVERRIWPRELADQIVAVRDTLSEDAGPLTTQDIARRFTKTRRHEVQRALESLSALGLIVRHADETAQGVWQSVSGGPLAIGRATIS